MGDFTFSIRPWLRLSLKQNFGLSCRWAKKWSEILDSVS